MTAKAPSDRIRDSFSFPLQWRQGVFILPLPFFRRKSASKPAEAIDPASIIMTLEEVRASASVAIAAFLAHLLEEGSTLEEIQGKEDGRALERAVAAMLNTAAMNYYEWGFQRLNEMQVMDKEHYAALASNANRVNERILDMLIDMGLKLEHMRDANR